VHGTVLSGVVAVSPTDVWAVGYGVDSNFNNYAIAMHWDGRRWSLIPVPGGLGSELFGVDGRMSTSVWAVGEQPSGETFVLHWDGQSWMEVPAPEPEVSETLYAVSVVSSTDAWAAGIAISATQTNPFTIHWDGSSWSEMPSVGCTGGCTLVDVRAPRPDDAWVVGVGLSTTPLAAHWDGSSWTTVPGGPAPGELFAVAPSGPASAWAVGQHGQCGGLGLPRPAPITAEAATSAMFRPACSAVLRRLHL